MLNPAIALLWCQIAVREGHAMEIFNATKGCGPGYIPGWARSEHGSTLAKRAPWRNRVAGLVLVCNSCEPGRAQPAHHATSCTPCSKGRFSKTRGAAHCTLCAVGQIAPSTGSRLCIACPKGKFSPLAGSNFCYDDSSRTAAPTPTPTASPTAAPTAAPTTAPTPCPGGTYTFSFFRRMSQQVASHRCVLCPKGKYQFRAGRLLCHLCPRGKHQPLKGYKYCIAITRMPTPFPTPSPAERARARAQKAAAQRAAAQKKAAAIRAAQRRVRVPVHCTAGRYCTNPGDASEGGVCGWVNGMSTHRPMNGTKFNFAPPSVAIIEIARATLCPKCKAGRFQAQPGRWWCDACPAGKFQPLAGAYACVSRSLLNTNGVAVHAVALGDGGILRSALPDLPLPLPTTTTTTTTTTTAGVVVPPSHGKCLSGQRHVPARRSLQREGDREGKREEILIRKGQCIDCSPGRFQSAAAAAAGAKACLPCGAGTFAPYGGSSACAVCPVGKYRPQHILAPGVFWPATRSGRAQRRKKLQRLGGVIAAADVGRACLPCPKGRWTKEGVSTATAVSMRAGANAKRVIHASVHSCSEPLCSAPHMWYSGGRCVQCPHGRLASNAADDAWHPPTQHYSCDLVVAAAKRYARPHMPNTANTSPLLVALPTRPLTRPSTTLPPLMRRGAASAHSVVTETTSVRAAVPPLVTTPAPARSAAASVPDESLITRSGLSVSYFGGLTASPPLRLQAAPTSARQWRPPLPPAIDAAAVEALSSQGCPAGHFARVQIFWGQKAPYCASCPVGKYAPRPGARTCKMCSPRAFTDTPGSAKCHDCPDGYIANGVRTLCIRSSSATTSPSRTHLPAKAQAHLRAHPVRVVSVGGSNSRHALARAPYLLNGPTQTQTASIGECMALCKQLFACSVGTFILSPGQRSHQCLLSSYVARQGHGRDVKRTFKSAFFDDANTIEGELCGRCQNFKKVH